MVLFGPCICATAMLAFLAHPADLHRTPAEILQWLGYPSEVHRTTTEDGYVLQLDRIPRHGRPAVFLANQMAGSASAYLVLGKGRALGCVLYDAGFDVWLGNFRGTQFSLGHRTLSAKQDKFWDFGWHENGALDNPAMMEYVLRHTGQPQLVFVGHSMGGTTLLVTADARPALLPRVRAAFLLAPAAFMGRTRERSLLALHRVANATQRMATALHLHKDPTELLQKVMDQVCGNATALRQSSIQKLCSAAGPGPNHHFSHDFELYFPSGETVNQLLHFAQLSDPKWPGFRKFNLGSAAANRARYGSDTPPDYSLARLTTPVYLYGGLADTTSVPEVRPHSLRPLGM